MSEKFQNKYRISSSRLKNWDYGENGAYFITICTRNRECFFGEIVSKNDEDEMQFNEIGKIANKLWLEIPDHFPFVELGNYQIMPNHLHGILIIDKKNVDNDVVETLQCNVLIDNEKTLESKEETLQSDSEKTLQSDSEKTLQSDSEKTLHCNVSTENKIKNAQMAKISPKSGTISTIIRSYKSVVTKNSHYIHADFEWQERFHDHIIRDSESFERIQNYIENNVANWNDDKFYN